MHHVLVLFVTVGWLYAAYGGGGGGGGGGGDIAVVNSHVSPVVLPQPLISSMRQQKVVLAFNQPGLNVVVVRLVIKGGGSVVPM